MWIAAKESGLERDSLVLCEQIRTLEKRRLRTKAGHVAGLSMTRVNRALAAALGMPAQDALC